MIENIKLSFEGIWSHKMRSFLTMLGVIIGIASIISIVSTIKGTSEQLKNKVIGSGNNLVTVTLNNGDIEYDPEYNSSPNAPILTAQQKEKVLKLDDVTNASFYYSRNYADSIYHNNFGLQGGKVYGIDLNYLDTAGYIIQMGRGFVKKDYEDYRKVALLDSNAATGLFETEEPLGKTIEIKGEPYIVVGIIRESQDSQPNIETLSDYYTYSQNSSGLVLVPDSTWPIIYQYDEPQNAIIKVSNTEAMSTVGKKAEDILNENLNVANTLDKLQGSVSEEDGEETGTAEITSTIQYKADDLLERAKNLQELSESTNAQLIWIASISLLVGGIGVMNIMLVSVTERTKEIGLKKAIGARKKTILLQFLTEAAVLTSIGGILGVLGGIVMSQVVHRVSGTPTAISVPAIVASVVFSTMIGLIFGFLPSVKAANLNPIDALRSE